VSVAYAAASKAIRRHESCLRELHELAILRNAEWQDALFTKALDADIDKCAYVKLICAIPAVTLNSWNVHHYSGVYTALGQTFLVSMSVNMCCVREGYVEVMVGSALRL
jgi:hypothetical protein